jgi:hypothetical protein
VVGDVGISQRFADRRKVTAKSLVAHEIRLSLIEVVNRVCLAVSIYGI